MVQQEAVKTWLACAFGFAACRAGISTGYVLLSRLLNDLGIGRADGSYRKQLEKLSRTQLLIIDDWGMSPPTDAGNRDILEIMEDRHQHAIRGLGIAQDHRRSDPSRRHL